MTRSSTTKSGVRSRGDEMRHQDILREQEQTRAKLVTVQLPQDYVLHCAIDHETAFPFSSTTSGQYQANTRKL